MAAWIGPAIAAGASLVGSALSARSGSKDRRASISNAQADRDLQREFAQHGIRWRVEDAQAAGIHPLYAMGANVSQASPTQMFVGGGTDYSGIGRAGQHIGRAVQAGMSNDERTKAKMQTLQLERGELENELLRSQIARERAQLGPPMPAGRAGLMGPLEGQGTGRTIREVPLQRTLPMRGMPHQEPGAIPELGFARTPTGLAPVPSEDAKQRMEDMIIPEMMWSLRNNLLPNVFMGQEPPNRWLPAGASHWYWHHGTQEWRPAFPTGGSASSATGRIERR